MRVFNKGLRGFRLLRTRADYVAAYTVLSEEHRDKPRPEFEAEVRRRLGYWSLTIFEWATRAQNPERACRNIDFLGKVPPPPRIRGLEKLIPHRVKKGGAA